MKLELIILVYKSVDYVRHINNEMKRTIDDVRLDDDVTYRFVANDATNEVIQELKNLDVDYTIYNDYDPDDYYLNRVYRAWNFGGKTSSAPHICFVNSDMKMHPDWLINLLRAYKPLKNIPVPRLIESAKMKSGTHAIEKNFGRHPNELQVESFLTFAERIKEDRIEKGGLYGCPIFSQQLFVKTGMYPEGNLYRMPDGSVEIGAFGKGEVIISGDAHYFNELNRRFGIKHVTVFDSIVYHIQEGEMDSND